MVVAIVLIVAALAIDEAFRPPLWLQLVIWAPVTIGAVLGVLRLFKVVNLYANYERRWGDPKS